MKAHINIVIRGKVQKIGFRHSTREIAVSLDIKGFVQNKKDGTVYIEAEGSPAQIERFLNWCKKGPPWAIVKEIIYEESQVIGYQSFEIRHSEK